MSYLYDYEPGATRYVRLKERVDPRKHKAPKGRSAHPIECDHHPLTFEPLQNPTWFVRETFVGEPA